MAINEKKFGDMAEEAVDKVGSDKVKEGIGKAADEADSHTGGKYEKQIGKGKQAMRSAVDKMGKKKKK